MSTNSNIAQFPGTGAQDVAPATDRRKNERQIATFRTCCVVIDGEARPAILRNLSDGGAMFEALVPAKPDTHLTYWWDGIDPVEARVAWVSGNRIGVANLSGPAEVVDVPRPRATRVPARLPVRVWSGCKGHRAQMADISLSGIAVEGLEGSLARCARSRSADRRCTTPPSCGMRAMFAASASKGRWRPRA